MPETLFRKCTNCHTKWKSVDDFLEDPNIAILGYQSNFGDLECGILLFNHLSCENTLGFEVRQFSHLQEGPVFTENKTGKDGCPGYCLVMTKLNPCKNNCECRWVRDVLQKIKEWQKV
ncbi:MAG: hypothetical protein ABFR63_11055 [Thermodesulfobacteriota bacterium]